MWKRLAIVVSVGLIFCGIAGAKPSDRPIDKETVRMAITIFRRTPSNQQGNMVRPIILRYAIESPDVEIASPKIMPWLEKMSKKYDEARAMLLTAYIAGNVQAQLDKRKTKDDPVAGTEQVIATYRQLQKTEPKLRIMAVEKLIDLQKQGKLAQHLKESP